MKEKEKKNHKNELFWSTQEALFWSNTHSYAAPALGKSNTFTENCCSLEVNWYQISKFSSPTHHFHMHFHILIDTWYLNISTSPCEDEWVSRSCLHGFLRVTALYSWGTSPTVDFHSMASTFWGRLALIMIIPQSSTHGDGSSQKARRQHEELGKSAPIVVFLIWV